MTRIPPIIPGDPYPYGVLVFATMPKDTPEEDRNELIKAVTGDLSNYEKQLGGKGLQVVQVNEFKDGKLEWIVDPLDKSHH